MPQHLSHSQVDCFLGCPKKYFYRYIEKLPRPVGPALILGSVYHSAMESNFRAKVANGGNDLPVPDVQDAFVFAWNKKVADSDIDWQEEVPGEVKDKGLHLVSLYMAEVAPFVMPAAVEHPFEIFIPEVADYTLKGVIDIITDSGIVIDHKTTGKSKSEDNYDKDMQPYAYALAMFQDPSIDVVNFEFQVAVHGLKTPKMQRLTTRRTRAQMPFYLELLSDVVKQIKSGIFPCNPTGNLCSKKWCGYWDICKGRGE